MARWTSQPTMTNSSHRSGGEPMPADPPESSQASGSRQRPPADPIDRAQGVKTPRGHHLLPDIRKRILDLYKEENLSAAQIAKRIPGLKTSQVRTSLRSPDEHVSWAKKRAQKLTGQENATSGDYQRLIRTKQAKNLTGRGDATSVDYGRIRRSQQATRD